ncbi:sigma-70 family RNA polymerase sigma factor [Streptomyces sp. B93]|uniref:sigma-70 family RNA polymerase sigma factor n=1 Tax=Streptomyces sp. B93 TaxID=2824875 RepID=UPI001B369A1C|nr:sigma-70 family RNA polymerase sigma factor [Streptomyces sp. B93]MBQ1088425.1 sigma-70 family RNA polymerase sigma factor [Streptomyces sp. B93]
MANALVTADAFEEYRGHLRAVAYRMLGSLAEADDAVQETWLRYSGADLGEVRNLGGWLTTVAGRVCLNMLRSRAARREQPMETYVPDPVVSPLDHVDPEREALLADSVGLALLVVLDTLEPAERLAFVLHDMFAVPFDDIAPVVERTPAATRQLASRARRRVQGAVPAPEPDLARQRTVLEAFLAASRGGDFEALVAVLHPDVVLRADAGAALSKLVRGAAGVVEQAKMFRQLSHDEVLVRVNDGVGAVAMTGGRVFSLMAVTVVDGLITEIDIVADPERLARLGVPAQVG